MLDVFDLKISRAEIIYWGFHIFLIAQRQARMPYTLHYNKIMQKYNCHLHYIIKAWAWGILDPTDTVIVFAQIGRLLFISNFFVPYQTLASTLSNCPSHCLALWKIQLCRFQVTMTLLKGHIKMYELFINLSTSRLNSRSASRSNLHASVRFPDLEPVFRF